MEQMIGTQELADLLKLKRRTVQKLCQDRKIPFYEVIPARYTFRLKEIEKWVGYKLVKPLKNRTIIKKDWVEGDVKGSFE